MEKNLNKKTSNRYDYQRLVADMVNMYGFNEFQIKGTDLMKFFDASDSVAPMLDKMAEKNLIQIVKRGLRSERSNSFWILRAIPESEKNISVEQIEDLFSIYPDNNQVKDEFDELDEIDTAFQNIDSGILYIREKLIKSEKENKALKQDNDRLELHCHHIETLIEYYRAKVRDLQDKVAQYKYMGVDDNG